MNSVAKIHNVISQSPVVVATNDYMGGSNENPFRRDSTDWLDYEMAYGRLLDQELNDIRLELANGS